MAKLTLTAVIALVVGAASLSLSGCGFGKATRDKMSAESSTSVKGGMAGDKMMEHDGMMSGGKMQADGMQKEGMMAGEKMPVGWVERSEAHRQ